jgi:hypothetical protein
MRERLSRLGARIGNANDQHAPGDTRAEHGARWRTIDRLAGWLYTLPDRRGRRHG